MAVLRPVNGGLVALTVILAAANGVLRLTAASDDSASVGAPRTAWQRWVAMTNLERAEWVQRHDQIAKRPDAGTLWHRARQLERMSEEGRRRRHALWVVMEETVARQPPADRRELLRANPGARAYLVYRILMQTEGERLSALREEWKAP
jgi:hypothetical protein